LMITCCKVNQRHCAPDCEVRAKLKPCRGWEQRNIKIAKSQSCETDETGTGSDQQIPLLSSMISDFGLNAQTVSVCN